MLLELIIYCESKDLDQTLEMHIYKFSMEQLFNVLLQSVLTQSDVIIIFVTHFAY